MSNFNTGIRKAGECDLVFHTFGIVSLSCKRKVGFQLLSGCYCNPENKEVGATSTC